MADLVQGGAQMAKAVMASSKLAFRPSWLSPELMERTRLVVARHLERTPPGHEPADDRGRLAQLKLPHDLQDELYQAMQGDGITSQPTVKSQLKTLFELLGDIDVPGPAWPAPPPPPMPDPMRVGRLRTSLPLVRGSGRTASRQQRRKSMPHKIVAPGGRVAPGPPRSRLHPVQSMLTQQQLADLPLPIFSNAELTITPVASPGKNAGGLVAPDLEPPAVVIGAPTPRPPRTSSSTSRVSPASPFQNSFQQFLSSPQVKVEPASPPAQSPGPSPLSANLQIGSGVTITQRSVSRSLVLPPMVSPRTLQRGTRPVSVPNGEFKRRLKMSNSSKSAHKRLKTLSEILQTPANGPTLTLSPSLSVTSFTSTQPRSSSCLKPPSVKVLPSLGRRKAASVGRPPVRDGPPATSPSPSQKPMAMESVNNIVLVESPPPAPPAVVETVIQAIADPPALPAQPWAPAVTTEPEWSQANYVEHFMRDLGISPSSNGLAFISVAIFDRIFTDFTLDVVKLMGLVDHLFSHGLKHFQFNHWAVEKVSVSVAKEILEAMGRVPKCLYDHLVSIDPVRSLEGFSDDSNHGSLKTEIHEYDRLEYLESIGLCTVEKARELSEAIKVKDHCRRSRRGSKCAEVKSRPESRSSEEGWSEFYRRSSVSVSYENICSGKLKPMFLPTPPAQPSARKAPKSKMSGKRKVSRADSSQSVKYMNESNVMKAKKMALPDGWRVGRFPRPDGSRIDILYEAPNGRKFCSLSSALDYSKKTVQQQPLSRKSSVEDEINKTPDDVDPHDYLPQTVQDLPSKLVPAPKGGPSKKFPPKTFYGIRPARKFAANQPGPKDEVATPADDDEPKKKKRKLTRSKRSTSTEQSETNDIGDDFNLANIHLPPHLEAEGWFTSKIEALKLVSQPDSIPESRLEPSTRECGALELEDQLLKAQLLAVPPKDTRKDGRVLVRHWGKSVPEIMELRQWRTKLKSQRKELEVKESRLSSVHVKELEDESKPIEDVASTPLERLKSLYSQTSGVATRAELPPGWARRTTPLDEEDGSVEVTFVHKSGLQVDTPLGAWQHFHHSSIKSTGMEGPSVKTSSPV